MKMKKKFDIPVMLKREPKQHLAIFSITGGGKSYFAGKFLNVPWRYGIHYDYLGKPSESLFRYYAETSEEAIGYMEELKRFAIITDNVGEIKENIRLVYPMLRNIEDNQRRYLAFDEIQYYSDDETIDLIFQTGRKYNISGIAIARNLQSIQKRSVSIISQCDDILLCGGITDITRQKIKTNYAIDIPDHVFDWVNKIEISEDEHGGIIRKSKHNYAWSDKHNWDLYDSNFNHVSRGNNG